MLASVTAPVLIPSPWGGAGKSASLTNSPDDSDPGRNTGMKSTTILPLLLVALESSVGRLGH